MICFNQSVNQTDIESVSLGVHISSFHKLPTVDIISYLDIIRSAIFQGFH